MTAFSIWLFWSIEKQIILICLVLVFELGSFQLTAIWHGPPASDVLFGKKKNPNRNIGMRFEAIKWNFIYFLSQKQKTKQNKTKQKKKKHAQRTKKSQKCSRLAYIDDVSFCAFNSSVVIFRFATKRSSGRMIGIY